MIRTLRTVFVAVALAMGLVAVSAGPASAAVSIFDSFEPPPAPQNWSFTHSGDGAGGFSSLQVRSGVRDAFISIRGNGFSSVGRNVFLSHPQNCSASVWVNPAPTGGFQLINFEIITPQFQYIALQTKTLDANAPYTKFSTSWTNSPTHFVVRISVVGNGPGTTVAAWVDDVSVSCA